jgi:hypothetical protein
VRWLASCVLCQSTLGKTTYSPPPHIHIPGYNTRPQYHFHTACCPTHSPSPSLHKTTPTDNTLPVPAPCPVSPRTFRPSGSNYSDNLCWCSYSSLPDTPIDAFVTAGGLEKRGMTAHGRRLVQRQVVGRGGPRCWSRGDGCPPRGRVGALRVLGRRLVVAVGQRLGSGGRISRLRLGASSVLLLAQGALRSSRRDAWLGEARGSAGGYAF